MLTTLSPNNTSFTSLRIGQATLIRKGLLDRPANFNISRLNPKNFGDCQAIFDIQRLWHQNGESDPLTNYFFNEFVQDQQHGEFYCVEKPGKQTLGERMAGVCEVYGNQLVALRTSPHNGQQKSRKVAGIGEVLLGHCLSIVRQKQHSKMYINSVNDSFYRNVFHNAGMTEGVDYSFSPASEQYSDIYVDLNRCINLFRRLNGVYKTNFPSSV